MKLYEISNELKELEQLVESGELTADDVKDTLDAIHQEREAKAVSVYEFMRNQEATIAAIDEEIKRFNARKKALTSSNDWLEGYLINDIAKHGEVKTDLRTLKLRKPSKVVVIDDESKVPDAFIVKIPESSRVDKKGLLSALRLGDVEGAHIEDGKQSLVVK